MAVSIHVCGHTLSHVSFAFVAAPCIGLSVASRLGRASISERVLGVGAGASSANRNFVCVQGITRRERRYGPLSVARTLL